MFLTVFEVLLPTWILEICHCFKSNLEKQREKKKQTSFTCLCVFCVLHNHTFYGLFVQKIIVFFKKHLVKTDMKDNSSRSGN